MIAILCVLSVLGAADHRPLDDPSRVGTKIARFELKDYLGTEHSLDEFRDHKVLVLVFLGTECPLTKLYGPRLAELSKEFAPRGVPFVGINSNRHDSLAEIAHYARVNGIEFPILKDPGNKIADQLGAKRTPEVFVLDEDRVVRYWGRIDDQFGVGYARAKVTRRHLVEAIEELLTDKPVSAPAVKPVGCFIGRVPRRDAKGQITYSNQIARILQRRCVQCHRTGEIAPFPLTSYDELAGWAETIREVLEDGRMPPWHASSEHGKFANDAQMPEAEKRLVYQWVENGIPEGDRKDLPKPVEFPEGWRIPKPDVVFTMPEPFTVPAKGVVEYQYFTIDPGFEENKWVRASQMRPGNPAVVHHAVLYAQPPGSPPVASRGGVGSEMIAAFAPGAPPIMFGDGFARLVPAGSKLVFQMHYTPTGTEQTDRSMAGLVFPDPEKVKRTVRSAFALNYKFLIPPRADNHRVEATYEFQENTLLHWLMPHMHFRGKSFRFDVIDPDGKRKVLLDVPRYDFYWQNIYTFTKPILISERSRLHCVAYFDNSEKNLANPNRNVPVRFGLQSWDEMMVGYFDFSPADQDLTLPPPEAKPLGDGRFEVTFRYKPNVPGKAVYLAGEFNEWKPTGHKMDGPDKVGTFTTRLTLNAGRYEYKFVIDGRIWRPDPASLEQAGFYRNSVLVVGQNSP